MKDSEENMAQLMKEIADRDEIVKKFEEDIGNLKKELYETNLEL